MSKNNQKSTNTYNLLISNGITMASKKEYNKAKINFFKAIETNSNRYEAYLNLSNIFILQNDLDECINILFNYLSINNFEENIVNHLAKICFNYNLEEKLKKLFAISELDSSSLKKNKKNIFFIQGQYYEKKELFEKAVESYSKSISCDKSFFDSYTKLFDLLEKMNKLEDFENYLNIAINNFKKINYVNIINLYKSILLNRQKKYIESKNLILEHKLNLIFNKNKTFYLKLLNIEIKNYENLKDYTNAFKVVKKRNSFVLNIEENKKFNKKNISNTIDKYKKFYTNFNLNIITKKLEYSNEENLVFLVGFPRSGTTLLDTILRSHSKIKVLEEKPFLLNLRHDFFKNKGNNLNSLLEITQKERDEIKNKYIESIISKKDDLNKTIIDKLPLSIIELGFIKCIFPKAKIIFSMRHPSDVVISCYFSSFKINDAMINFLDWSDTLNFYNDVLKLFDFYEKELNLNFFLIKYEDIVKNFETHIKLLLNYLNLKYEKKMEKFYLTAKKRSKISTPSYDQVINPLYNKSIGRWKNYSKFLNSQNELNRWIKKYNY